MPVKCKNPKYRVKTTKTGKRVRLVFCNGKVVEAKKLKNKGLARATPKTRKRVARMGGKSKRK